MPKLVKNSEVLENGWQTLDKNFEGELPEGLVLVPLTYFLNNASSLTGNNSVGVWIDSDEGPEALENHVGALSLIAINFPKFADGRGYSFARILRDRYGYQGELRAIGDILHDQLFYLQRCGFDAFAIREDKDASVAAKGLKDFSNSYQAASDQTKPLFRRRA